MAVQVIVADSQAQAHSLAQKVEVWGVELANGQRVTVASEEQAYAFARQAGSEPLRIARRAQSLVAGTAESVLAQLDALHHQWGLTNSLSTHRLRTAPRARSPCVRWRRRDLTGGQRMRFGEQLIAGVVSCTSTRSCRARGGNNCPFAPVADPCRYYAATL